jgi:vanillin dehydrogenase
MALKEYKFYVNGEWCASSTGEVVDDLNPYTGQVFARVHLASAADVDAAIGAAHAAAKGWGERLAYEREAILCKAADIVERRAKEIAQVLVDEGGNVWRKAMFECFYTASTLRLAAGQAREVRGETMPSDSPNVISMTFRRPLGVVAGISPFNAPLLLSGKKLAPALAAGNAFVLKPSPYTPVACLLFAEIFEEAGLPPGVLNVIPTSLEALGDTFFSDPRVRLVTFTGSAATGRRLSAEAGKHQKRLVLELGGKSPLAVCADADLDYAVDAAAFGIFFNQGQVCMANSRIVVEAPIYDEFCRRFVEKVRAVRAGDPNDPQTAVGPLIDPKQCAFVRGHVDDALAKGARLLAGGSYEGAMFEPTALADVTPAMRVYGEESFGPLTSVLRARDFDEIVALANDTAYGLSAGIVTNDLQKAFAFALRVESGAVHINDSSFDDDPNAPFGGVKGSGSGRENGRYSIADMTELKWVTVQLGRRQFPF